MDYRTRVYLTDTDRMAYYVTYKNQGKPEKTPPYPSKEEATEVARFLKFQGAVAVRIQSA